MGDLQVTGSEIQRVVQEYSDSLFLKKEIMKRYGWYAWQ